MKILLVSLNYTPEKTGIGKFQGEMGAWLARRGHKVRAIAAPPYYPAWKISATHSGWRYTQEKIAGVDVTRVPLYVPAKPNGLKRVIHLVSFMLTSFPIIVAQGLFWKPDAIFVSEPPLLATPAVLIAAWLSGARACLHVQDFEIDAATDLGLSKESAIIRLVRKMEKFLMRAFPITSTISPRMRDRLIAKGVAPTRTHLVPNWASIDDFDPLMGAGNWPQKLKKNPDDVIVLYSGNLGRKQGIETIVDIARHLQAEKHLRFIICGDGAVRPKMEQAAKGMDNIIFLPLQDNRQFIHLMMAADIHLLPQKAEAADLVMPSKLGNILASGKPVVAGAHVNTQLRDAIEGCGLAVTPEHAGEFATAIKKLADDPALRHEMGQRGLQRAREEWSRDAILTKLEYILRTGQSPAGEVLADRNEASTGKDKTKAA